MEKMSAECILRFIKDDVVFEDMISEALILYRYTVRV